MPELNEFCTFYLGNLFFGIEVHKVQEVLRNQSMTSVPLASSEIGGLINLRGQIVVAIDLRRKLGLPRREERSEAAMNIVVRHDDAAVSLLVDAIGDVVEVDESAFEPPPETLTGEAREAITGVYKLKGKILHVLNTEGVLSP